MFTQRALPWLLLTLVCCLALGVGLGALLDGDAALAGGQAVQFTASTGDVLAGTYTPGRLPVGILLLEGFYSDQASLTPAASEFAAAGAHVFRFDFSGQGRSPGQFTLDNAATDRLAQQALAAKVEFKRLSGLSDDQIILLGHSLGARAALQAAVLNSGRVAGLVLMAPPLDLTASTATGVNVAELAWVQALGPNNPPVDLLIVTGELDDILTPAAAQTLLQTLSGAATAVAGQTYGATDQSRQLLVFPTLVHNYEPYSPRVLAAAKAWAGQQWGRPADFPAEAPAAAERVVQWPVIIIFLFITLANLRVWLDVGLPEIPAVALGMQISNMRRFLLSKLWLWAAALPLAALVAALCLVIPLGRPVFTLLYAAVLSGHGLLALGLYAAGRMPGVTGRLAWRPAQPPEAANPTPAQTTWARWGWLAALGLAGLLLLFSYLYARTGWWLIPPLGQRLTWLLLLTPVTALGFWAFHHETSLLRQAAPGRWQLSGYIMLMGLLPFILTLVAMLVAGSLAGEIEVLHGLTVLALVLVSGELFQRLGQRAWLSALLQAVLLYWIVLAQGTLFAF
jgi:pimeloyl-ACP methyl ester carboxylesterase